LIRLFGLLLAAISCYAKSDGDSSSFHSRWHVIIGITSSDLSSSEIIRTTYTGSQYPFVAVPKIYTPQLGLQYNFMDRVRLGAELNLTHPVSYRASNWYKLALRTAPTTRFDVYEKISGFSGQIMAHRVLVPVRYTISRFEVAVNSGISLSRINTDIRHEYIFCQNGNCSQDISLTRSASGTIVGGLLGLNFDFYWTRNISTQFRVIGRSTTSFSIKPVRYTYVTLDLRGRNPTSNERYVSGHSFNLSGVDFSLSMLFHL
jgi:hypothetical protein